MSTHAEYAVKGDSAARRILSGADTDRLGEAILALTAEIWVVTDRMMVLEEILRAKGLEVTADIDAFVPSPEMETRLDARRDRLIANLMNTLTQGSP